MVDICFLKNASRCAMKDKKHPRAYYLSHVFIKLVENDLDIVASDGNMLYKKTLKDYLPNDGDKELLEKGVLIDFDFTKIKIKYGMADFYFKDKYFNVHQYGDPKMEKYSFEIVDADFLNYNKAIPDKEKSEAPKEYYRFSIEQYKTLNRNGFLCIMPVNNPNYNKNFLLFDKPGTGELMVLVALKS